MYLGLNIICSNFYANSRKKMPYLVKNAEMLNIYRNVMRPKCTCQLG